MKTTEEILDLLRQYKRTVGDKYGIEQLGLFGSAARGEQREGSDIDICVKLRKTSFRTYMAVKEDLEQLFHIKVDLLTLHENMRQLFRQNIGRDAIYV
ncbi:nucleotidyltransferase family protein [Phocaeicola sp.]